MDYGDIIYMHSPASSLKPLDVVYLSALSFMTGNGFRTHPCLLCEKAGWQSLAVGKDWEIGFKIYAPHKQNNLQKLDNLIPFNHIKCILLNIPYQK